MLEQPSASFTGSVMNKLGISPSVSTIKYEPVISSGGWILISIIFITLCILGLSGGDSTGSMESLERVGQTINNASSLFENMLSGSFTLILTVSAFAILLLFAAEAYYRRSRLHSI